MWRLQRHARNFVCRGRGIRRSRVWPMPSYGGASRHRPTWRIYMTSTTSGWVETQASVGGPFELDDVELSSSALTQKEGVVADAATLVVPVAPRGDGDRGVIFFSCRIGGVWHERRRDNIVASSGASHPSWQWHGARRSSQRLRSVQLHLCIWWRSLSHGGGRLPGCALLGMSLLPCFFFPCICLAPLFSRSYYCVRAA